MEDLMQFLCEEGISEDVLHEVHEYVVSHPVSDAMKQRIPVPHFMYYGVNVWEDALCALLCGKNILLVGEKATGKNVLCENLAYVFQRPSWDISFHVNMDAASLIGTDSFENGKVVFREGPVYRCALNGGFGILDEINMAKNDAVSVLHATLDYRRSIDVPGYDKIELHDAARFIGTMNYGYAGTKELNEALVSRFMVIDMPEQTPETLEKILRELFSDGKKEALDQFAGLFLDLQMKAENGEISTKAVDLRGILASLKTIRQGLTPLAAVRMGVINKCFDGFEKEIVEDVVLTRIPEEWNWTDIF